jgi:hypothetical protein
MIGGWSAGGIMAYEISQQLESLGHHVALLVLFDTPNPFFMREYSKIEAFRVRSTDSFKYHLANLRRMDFIQMPAYIARKLGARLGRKRRPGSNYAAIPDTAGEPMKFASPRRSRFASRPPVNIGLSRIAAGFCSSNAIIICRAAIWTLPLDGLAQ